MFGSKKRAQRMQEAEEANLKAEEARKRAEEAEREAREAEAAADALKAGAAKEEKKKFSLFSVFKKKPAEQAAEPAEPAPVPVQSAPEEAPQPAPQAAPQPAPQPVPQAAPQPVPQSAPPVQETPEPAPAKLSRKERKRLEREDQKKDARIKELEEQLRRAEKKSKSARFCDFFAFIILLAAAVLMLLGPVLKLILEKAGTDYANALATVSTVAQYCLLAAIALPAWYFVYRKSLGWKIVFVIALAGFITGTILGLTL